MRRQLLARGLLARSGQNVLELLLQLAQLPLQQFDLLLLSVNSEIDFFHQILGQADPGLEFDKTLFHRRFSGQDQPGSTSRRLMIGVRASTGYTIGIIWSLTRVNTPT